ncbi:MAG: glycoside hydrolase family 2 TIM barrel-domain containing protein [Nonlabens sp.]
MSAARKNIGRSLTIVGYVAAILIIMIALSQLFLYFNSGADRSKILKVSADVQAAHAPLISWDTSFVKGRQISVPALADLEKDYKMAWHSRALAFEVNDSVLLNDYFTKNARAKITEVINYNDSLETSIRSTSLEHHLKLELYSEDGQLVVLTDSAAVEHRRTYLKEELVHETTDKSTYEIMMLLEDGHWRIRHMILKDREPLGKVQQTSADFISNWRGINYYPQATPWNTFGDDFDIEVIEEDFELIESLGLNSIRIFIGYEDFGKEYVDPKKLKKVRLLLDAAEKNNLQVLVTLFDFYGNYDLRDWTFAQQHAVGIVKSLKDHPAIAAWDLKNEPDLDFESRKKYRVESWLKFMAQTVKREDPNHPVTIGWSNIEAARNLSSELDFVSFHYYTDLDELAERTKALKTESDGRPILLSEYGRSSHTGWWQIFTDGPQQQAEYHKEINDILKEQNIGSQVWTLYDFPEIPEDVFNGNSYEKNLQKKYGFIDADGNRKQSFSELKE